jgi:hypothetical protein
MIVGYNEPLKREHTMDFSSDEQHVALRSPATLKLGQLHWYLLRCSKLMDSLCYEIVEKPSESPVKVKSSRLTPIGEVVGRDEIDWWINAKEDDLDDFCQRSKNALDAAQALKEAVVKLKGMEPASYEELLTTLRGFAEMHSAQIDVIYDYARWLYGRNKVAPHILFTYKVWGSTRRADRMLSLTDAAETPEEESPEIVSKLMEIVLGVSTPNIRNIDLANMELSYEIFESLGETGDSAEFEIVVPSDRLLRRATRMILDECVTYFSSLRDSLRDILNEIGKREHRENLVTSDAFWRSFVSKAIASGKVETQLWDFKQTLTMWHSPKGDERRRAKVTFAEEVASFANADGGCLIVGVSDQREVMGIAEAERDKEDRIKTAHDALVEHFQYPRVIYRLQQVLIPDRHGAEKLCLIVVVARACGPVGVRDGEGRYTYPVRNGTGTAKGDPEKLHAARRHDKNDHCNFLTELKQFVRDN